MPRLLILLSVLLLAACQPELTPAEKAAKDRAECQTLAAQQSGFDPLTSEAPPRTISRNERRGGEVVGSGEIARGAGRGAAVGAIGGAIAGDAGSGAAAGAAMGGLLGGIRRHKETNEVVTRTYANPEYEQYAESKQAFKTEFDGCIKARAGASQ